MFVTGQRRDRRLYAAQYMLTIPQECWIRRASTGRASGESTGNHPPLATPALAVLAIFSVMWRGTFSCAAVSASRKELFTLPVAISSFQWNQTPMGSRCWR